MKRQETLVGVPIHKYVEIDIWRINSKLKEAGCIRAKALCKNEESSESCKFSCLTEDEITPFKITLGDILEISIKRISWVGSGAMISIVFD